MIKEEAKEIFERIKYEHTSNSGTKDSTAKACDTAIRSFEAWDEVIKFVSDRIEYWDAPCSGDEVVRKELASVMWEIGKQMKEV